ncbi:MAG: hypothetical protein HDS65_03845 [Bacteroidales bacterium]|nr:hypothetical protein [Bacteroidales bacterium]
MKLRTLFTALFILIVGSAAISAASPSDNPVRWRTIVKATGANTGTVTFKALISEGWHLYGLNIPEGGPKATSFDLKSSTDIKFTGPITPSRKPLTVDDPLFGLKLDWWDTNVEFTVPFKVTGAAPRIECKINYMSCDGNSCRPPKTETIATPVKL